MARLTFLLDALARAGALVGVLFDLAMGVSVCGVAAAVGRLDLGVTMPVSATAASDKSGGAGGMAWGGVTAGVLSAALLSSFDVGTVRCFSGLENVSHPAIANVHKATPRAM